MAKPKQRTYSQYTKHALTLLARLIKSARLEQRLSMQEVSERAGISRSLLQRIEKADARCEIGATFEVATLLGVNLFNADPASSQLAAHIKHSEQRLALLPKKARKSPKEIDDDF
ncbi:MAG: helix-turn-helix domain-containing protein [Pseudomonadota bacterium]